EERDQDIRGTPTAYAVTTPTARFPFSWFCQQSEANISGCWLFVFYFSHREFRITISDIEWINRCL
ncbi:TPA: hypothetical protein ACPZQN_003197, partial [Yersinia enterocolitica]